MSTKKLFTSFLALLIVSLMVLGLCACGGGKAPEEQFKDIEEEAFENAMDNLSGYLENSKTNQSLGVKVTGNVELSSTLLSLLSASAGGMDFSFINDAEIALQVETKDSLMSANMGLLFKNASVISMDAIANLENGDMYLAIPELIDKYLFVSAGELSGTSLPTVSAPTVNMESIDVEKLIPLIEKYYGIYLDGLTNVEKSNGNFAANGVSQKCTVFKTTLTEKDCATIVKNLLTEIKIDTELKLILLDLFEAVGTTASGMDSPESIYADMIEEIDSTLRMIDEQVFSAGADASVNDTLVTMTSYVNKDEVIGRTIEFKADDNERVGIMLGSATSGKSTGFELSVSSTSQPNMFAVRGTLNEDKGLINGSFDVLTGAMDPSGASKSVLVVKVSNVDKKQLDKGYFNGSITLSMGEGLLNSIMGSGSGMAGVMGGLSIASYALRMDIASGEKTNEVTLALLNGEVEYASISLKAEEVEVDTITTPNASDTIVNENQWLGSLDLNGFLNYLDTQTELPDSVIQMIFAIIYGSQY